MLREAWPDLLTTLQQSGREFVSMATSARLSSSSSSLLLQEDEGGSAGTYCICQASFSTQGFRKKGDVEGQTSQQRQWSGQGTASFLHLPTGHVATSHKQSSKGGFPYS